MRFSKRFLAGLLLFVIQWIGAGQGSVNAQDAKPRSVRLPITLEADQHTELHARVQGYVEKVHVDIGDRVTKEQLLVTLDAPELEADVQRHKQMVMQAQANLGVAIGGVTVAEARLRQAGSGSRSDLDLQALWEIENLGFGVAAKRSRAGSQLAQRRTQLADLRDEITSQVVQAYEDVANYRMQIDASNLAMKLAEASYERNLQRVKADEGLPIELLQAINARAETLQMRTLAVSNYNRSQLRLLHATGGLRH